MVCGRSRIPSPNGVSGHKAGLANRQPKTPADPKVSLPGPAHRNRARRGNRHKKTARRGLCALVDRIAKSDACCFRRTNSITGYLYSNNRRPVSQPDGVRTRHLIELRLRCCETAGVEIEKAVCVSAHPATFRMRKSRLTDSIRKKGHVSIFLQRAQRDASTDKVQRDASQRITLSSRQVHRLR